MEKTIHESSKEQAAPSVLDLLLGKDVVDVSKNLPTAKYEVPRLSKAAGAPVVFTLQALPYGRTQDMKRLTQDRSCLPAA